MADNKSFYLSLGGVVVVGVLIGLSGFGFSGKAVAPAGNTTAAATGGENGPGPVPNAPRPSAADVQSAEAATGQDNAPQGVESPASSANSGEPAPPAKEPEMRGAVDADAPGTKFTPPSPQSDFPQ